MDTWNPAANDVFLKVLELTAPEKREAFLDVVCRDDAALRAEVEAHLAAKDRAGSFLESPHAAAVETFDLANEVPGTIIGHYKLLEQIGEGGFGVVFMAEQARPVRRKVALKILKPGMDSRQVVARFEAERQALALMDHPNIAKVLDAGSTDTGRPYFVMELVHGIPVTEFCDRNRLPVRDRLGLFVQVCRAVQHAHQKGVIHRDLKPTNVLVTLRDGVPVPQVIDFGIAKALGQPLTDKTLFTGFAQMVGTPLYMSPEQAELSGLDVDTRSDVYSLGVMLYELLVGTTPFDIERLRTVGLDEVRRIIKEEEPVRPSARLSTLGLAVSTVSANRGCDPKNLSQSVRGELDWVVMKALEKDRNRRYDSASALATDIQRYLADEPVQACPPSTGYRLRKFARRNRREVLAAGAVAVAGVVAITGLVVSRAVIAKALDSESRAKEELRIAAYFQRITLAHRELSIGNVAAALKALDECPNDLRGWEWHYLMRLFKVGPLILQDKAEVYGVAFRPDGKFIASAGKDGNVKIWEISTGKVLRQFKAHDIAACSVAYHPNGRHIASAGADQRVKVWDLAATQKPMFERPCDAIRKFGAAYTVAFRPPNGQHLAVGCKEDVWVWDWKDDQFVYKVPGPQYSSIPVAFSDDGQYLATGGTWDQGLCIYDAESRHLLGTLPEPRHPVTALAFRSDGKQLISASLGRTVNLWNTTTRKLLNTIEYSGNVLGAAFDLEGKRFATTGEDKLVHVRDTVTGRKILGLQGHEDMCGCVAFSPDGLQLASCSHDRTIIVWDATPLRGNEGQELFTFDRHDHEVRSVAISPDSRSQMIASGGNGTSVLVWDATTGRVSYDFPRHSAPVFAIAWHPDGRRIATAGSAGRQNAVIVWDASDGRKQFEIPVEWDPSAGPYQAVAFSPDKRFLVTGQQEGAVQVWDAETGQKVCLLTTHEREIRSLVFSRDGRTLATASGNGTVKLWDALRLNEKQVPRPPVQSRIPGPSVNVAFSPDGKWLVTGGDKNTVKIWEIEKGGVLFRTLEGHLGEVYTIAVSGDEKRWWIASGGEDSIVKVWNGRNGKLIHNYRGHTGLISSLAFSSDGKRLYSGSRDKTIKVWDMSKLGDEPKREKV